ncbi:MAG: BlaI/MecI/CopY family transcriptional regulator [Planctomycetota bacterium]
MARRSSTQPTEVELEILRLLWDHGPSTLGQVHDAASARSDRAYSTTRKMLQVMRDKGLVACDDSAKPQLYSAAISQEATRLGLVDDIATRAFDGSAKKLVMSLLSAERITVDDVREMQRLVNKAKRGKK